MEPAAGLASRGGAFILSITLRQESLEPQTHTFVRL